MASLLNSIGGASLLYLDYTWISYLAAVVILTYVFMKALKLHRRGKELLKIHEQFPGTPCHWLFGNIHQFHEDGTYLDTFVTLAAKYHYANTLWVGKYIAYLCITHPDYAKAILARTDPKDRLAYDFLIPWIGKGLLVLSGPKWLQHRRLLTPGFHYDVLKPYVKIISGSMKVMLDKWEKIIVKDNSVELFQHVSLMTLDSIMKCAFSYESSCQVDSDNTYTKAVHELSHLVDLRFRMLPYHSDLIFHLSPHGYRFRKARRIAHDHTDKVIKQRKELMKNEATLEKIQQKRHLDFLDILLCARDENGVGLSDEDLRAEVDTFMFAGHDTTASGISWIIYSLAKYPEYQEKCREEIKEILGDRDSMEWEDLAKMTYTTLFIKEVLRLYPPVPGMARQLVKPVTFLDGRTLPAGALVIVSFYAIHRDPIIWSDPEVFDPSRFLPENSSHRHSHAYMPFSAGSRNCIGQNFAMNEMKVATALSLQRFQFSLDETKVPLKMPQIILRSMNGIYVKMKKIRD
ncbi:cytochrome P450 4B1-like [Ambystoma mexicanum]|uniref:cytochrome P450 4B1-like n=1 Tax=Ambystoma mexicanum TaxID=8296 RepID=UPI0037E899C4